MLASADVSQWDPSVAAEDMCRSLSLHTSTADVPSSHSHSHSDAEGSDVDFVSRTPSRYAKSSYSTNASARRSKTPTPVSHGVTPLSTNSGTVNGRRY